MSGFESASSQRSSQSSPNISKQPIKRLEPAIHKFVKVALPTDLERLNRHKLNMEKFYNRKSWHDLDVEQINAARTVQQLKANMRQLENTRNQVQPSDQAEFDSRVAGIKLEALESIRSFSEVQRLYSKRPSARTAFLGSDVAVSEGCHSNDSELNLQQQQQQLVTDEAAVASWDSLRESLEELNELIHDFAAMVHHQQEAVDSISDNIEHAQHNVEQATIQLGKASKLKAAMFPVIGAAVGAVAGGPVGLVVGMKVGAAAAVAGGVTGFVGGVYFKRRRDERTDIELDKLSSRNAIQEGDKKQQ